MRRMWRPRITACIIGPRAPHDHHAAAIARPPNPPETS